MGRERRVVHVSSSEEMLVLGREVASRLKPGSVLALSGDLGAGKTTFVKGLALGLKIEDPIQSPTFVYMNQYLEGKYPLFHFDLYRMKGEGDFLGMGFFEYFDASGICAIEWPERIESILPQDVLKISFAHEEKGRMITFDAMDGFSWA